MYHTPAIVVGIKCADKRNIVHRSHDNHTLHVWQSRCHGVNNVLGSNVSVTLYTGMYTLQVKINIPAQTTCPLVNNSTYNVLLRVHNCNASVRGVLCRGL